MRKSWSGFAALLVVATACGSRAPSPPHHTVDRSAPVEKFRLAGEYEAISDLVLAWSVDVEDTLREVIALAEGRAAITIIVDPSIGADAVQTRLEDEGIRTAELKFVEHRIEAPWIRDYGPMVLAGDRGSRLVLDFDYFDIRPDADRIPQQLARELWPGSKVVRAALKLSGGNLVSDGNGVCVTAEDGEKVDRAVLRDFLSYYGACRSLIVVPSLLGEPTGHVDMFAFSPGPGQFVVGSYDQKLDPMNSQVLDEATQILTDHGLHVSRIPMPEHSDDVFRSYTNLLPLGDLVLVPTYDDENSRERDALEVISKALPGREVVGLDSRRSIELEGALHCLTLTSPQI